MHCSIMTQGELITPGVFGRFAPVLTAKRAADTRKIGSVLLLALRDIGRVNAHLAYRRVGNALRGMLSFAHCRTREDIIASQAALIGEDLELVGGALKRAGEIVAAATGEAVRATIH